MNIDVDGNAVTSLGGWVLAALAMLGGGIKWAISSRDQRERWIETRVDVHVAKLEARLQRAEDNLTRSEREKTQLVVAFQMLAAEVQRLDPASTVLQRTQSMFALAFPIPQNSPDAMSDLMDELHRKTR